jgi:uncharacterized protein YjiS (DUF1127 family)
MAHVITHAHDAGIAGRLGALLERLSKRYVDHRLYRRTLAELEGLNDRELLDIGVSRLSVRDLAWSSVYGQ